jgi:hypothetical protein
MKFNFVKAFIIILLLSIGNNLIAQTTQASISGVVSNSKNQLIEAASVKVINESTGFSAITTTNLKGEYSFQELPLGNPYTIIVNFVGFGEQKRTGFSLNQGDALNVNISLQEQVQTLAVVEVVASGLKNKTENLGAATAISAKIINKLPVNGRNFTTLIDLSPLSRGGSISGQLGSSTNFTIDGMNAKNPTSAGSTTSRSGAPYSISMEAVREFKVVTNQYDVTYGRSGGGIVSAVTKAGTNNITGSVFNFTRNNGLSSTYDIRGNKRNDKFNTTQTGFSLGGPIIKNKLHFFITWDHQTDSRPLIIADVQSPVDEARFNVTKVTIDRFVDIARRVYGTSSSNQYGTFDKKRLSDAVFARFDLQINKKNLLTLRNNFTYDLNKLGLQDNTAINIYESFGNDKNIDNSLLLTLRTSVNSKLTNELKLQHLYTYQNSSPGDQLPSANIPRAIVEGVTSIVGGAVRSTNIQMGGHRFAQENFTNNVVQLVDNIYYNTENIKYTFGFDLMYTNALSRYGSEVNGRFHYTLDAAAGLTALDKFEKLQPYRFYREVPLMADPTVKGNTINTGIYGQMQTKLTKGLDFIGGLRLDGAIYPSSPLNQLVLSEVGVRTDNKLKSFVIQPRFQFNWDINERHKDFIRFGAGIFSSDINNYMVINNLSFDGKHFGTVDVRVPNIPPVDFNAYRNNVASIPSLSAFQVPTINTNAADAQIPVMYKANLSYTKFITEKLKVGITGFVTLGRNNYMYTDRNMVAKPFFTLANEANRGVFVPLSSMPTNGAGDWQQGRISNKLGRVLELNSKGKVNNYAVVFDATYQYYKDGEINVSYTWNDTKDNTSYNGNVANTATLSLPVKDDPRDLSTMSYSDNHFRHKVVVFGNLPTFYGFNLGFRYSGLGGTRYSLLSGANTNADFVSGTNDLAFIFDRNDPSVPQNVRTGIQAILDNPLASQSFKDYIINYSGKIAARNGGINGFFGTVDLRLTKRLKVYKNQSIELSVDLFNFSNYTKNTRGANESLGNQALYALGIPATSTTPAVANFDKVNQRYVYRVNSSGLAIRSGNPYQFQIGVRYAF